jgi:hypothetical protein
MEVGRNPGNTQTLKMREKLGQSITPNTSTYLTDGLLTLLSSFSDFSIVFRMAIFASF